MKILVVDDERSIRNTLKEILEYEGHEIALAENGLVAIEMVKANLMTVYSVILKCPKWMVLKYWTKYRK